MLPDLEGGSEMPEHPLDVFKRIDPELLKLIENNRDFALADGELPRKFKLLIAMSLDATHGKVEGTMSLARQAMEAGDTKEQVTEAIRVTQYISGAGSMFTAGRGLKELF
jgi:alkylhydroperoxidase/carboxymuconolactone decarboxylase family protein YurZ